MSRNDLIVAGMSETLFALITLAVAVLALALRRSGPMTADRGGKIDARTSFTFHIHAPILPGVTGPPAPSSPKELEQGKGDDGG